MAANTAIDNASSARAQAKNAFVCRVVEASSSSLSVAPGSASYQLAPITIGTSTVVSRTISRPSPSTPSA